MKTNKKIKNLFCCIVAFALAIVANLGFLKFENPQHTTYAAGETNSLPISLNNPTFKENTSSTYPFKPKSYEPVLSDNTVIENIDNANFDAGVINVTDSEYSSRFENLEISYRGDDYVLMIDGGNIVSSRGYRTTNSITLSKGGNYLISVDVYTAEGGSAELRLTTKENSKYVEFDSISNISSNERWTTYYFLVTTNDMEDVNVQLSMYLKGAGVAMFDNIVASQINDKYLNSYINSNDYSERISYTNKSTNILNEFTANDFELSRVNYEIGTTYTSLVKDNISDGKNEIACKITNSSKSYAQIESTQLSDSITNFNFEQNKVYKVTINAKTENLQGTATLKLVQIVENDEEATEKAINITTNSTTTNTITNGFTGYSFYIKSSPIEATDFKLEVILGTESEKTSGTIYISSIVVSSITDSVYSSASTNNQIDLSSVDANSYALTNGEFNSITIEDSSKQYPATPSSWDITPGEHKQVYGVVNTSEVEFAKLTDLTNLSNPLDTRNNSIAVNNNILMLHNTQADILSYTSATKALTVDTNVVHKFEAKVLTQNAPVTVSLVAKNSASEEFVLTSVSVNTNGKWETVELYLKEGYAAIDVSVKITLESDSWAYAYVDDVFVNNGFDSTSEDAFTNALTGRLSSKVDLSKLIIGDNNSNFDVTNMFSGEGENAIFGVVNVNNGAVTGEGFTYTTAENVIGIRAASETYYKVTSNTGFYLESGNDKFYKLSIDVYTQHLQMLSEDAKTDLIGAGIKLSSFEETFTSIVSNNGWTTYTFYLSPDASTTTYIELYFGSEDAKMIGDVFFGNIIFESDVSEIEFNNAKNNSTTKVLKQTSVDDDNNDDTTKTNENDDTNINWWYFASSLIFALAIIICVVGVMLKKVKFKKPVKKSKNEYDRNRTVSKQYYMRKATTLREEKLRELEKDLETLHNERIKYEEDYKNDLAKLRQLKIKRANADEIKKLEKDMKKNQKLSASIGVTINRVQADIDYVKTDAYINATIKRLSSQPANNAEQNK